MTRANGLTMVQQSSNLKAFLFGTSLLSTSATAQTMMNNTNSSGCAESFPQKDWPVNVTGTANVSDFYLSTTFGDYRNDTSNDSTPGKFEPMTISYLTAPPDSHGQAFVYLYRGVDNRGRGGGPNGCEGVLPQVCVDLLERKLKLPTNMPPGGTTCPAGIRADDDELNEACGNGTILMEVFGLSSTIDLANTTSSCNDNPKGIDLNPNGYTTRELFGWSAEVYGTDPQNFTWYDEYVTRPVPMILFTSIDGRAEAKVVCITMGDVEKGSCVSADSVNNRDDNKSAAVGIERKSKAGIATVMAVVAAMSFVLT